VGKFVVLDSHTLPEADFHQEREILEKNGFECVIARCKTVDEVIESAKDADCIGVVYFHIDENIISQLKKCKAIIRYGIGYDVVDVKAATKRGIAVCNLPDYCVIDVSTHAMALLLDLCRKTTLFDRTVRKGVWDPAYGYEMHRLSALTLGLVGFGNTARLLSHYVKAFDMRVVASDPYLEDSVFAKYGVKKVSLDELYKISDVISIHVPITKETIHMINKDTIAKMKDGVMIINTSRGTIIKLEDLLDALETDKVRAAGLDVMEGEPIRDADHRLYRYDNIVVTPHIAYNSIESSEEQHMQVAETAVTVLRGEIPQNTVNKKQLGLY